MRIKITLFIMIISAICLLMASSAIGQTGPSDRNGFLKGSEVYLSLLKRVSGEKHFIDTFVNKEVDSRMRFSIWRSDDKNVVMNFGAQSLFAPQYTSSFLVSLISFEVGFDYYHELGSSGRYRIRGFLSHRSQHILDLPKLGIKIPKSVNDDLEKNIFHDLNVLGVGIERSFLPGDKLRYNFKTYIQPYNSGTLQLWRTEKYKRPLFVGGEIFLPFSFARNRLSVYGMTELGKSSLLGILETRMYPMENLVVFIRQSFISDNNEAVVTPHSGVVYRGFKIGLFIKVGNLFN